MRTGMIRRILVGGGVLVLSGSGLAFAGSALPDQAGDAAEEHVPADAGRPEALPATAASAATAATTTTTEADGTTGGDSVDVAQAHDEAGTADASAFGACVSDEAHEDPHDGDEPPADCWDEHPVLSGGPGTAPETAGASRTAEARGGAPQGAGARGGDTADDTADE